MLRHHLLLARPGTHHLTLSLRRRCSVLSNALMSVIWMMFCCVFVVLREKWTWEVFHEFKRLGAFPPKQTREMIYANCKLNNIPRNTTRESEEWDECCHSDDKEFTSSLHLTFLAVPFSPFALCFHVIFPEGFHALTIFTLSSIHPLFLFFTQFCASHSWTQRVCCLNWKILCNSSGLWKYHEKKIRLLLLNSSNSSGMNLPTLDVFNLVNGSWRNQQNSGNVRSLSLCSDNIVLIRALW